MQIAEQVVGSVGGFVAKWAAVISDLGGRKQTVQVKVEELKQRKEALCLEALMGSAEARNELKRLNGELSRLGVECEDIEVAIRGAETRRLRAERAAAVQAERERKGRISAHLEAYFGHAKRFDELLEQLASECRAAWGELHASGTLMTPAERTPLNLLNSRRPLTLAAAFRQLDKHMELAPSFLESQKQPLAKFANPIVSGWITRKDDRNGDLHAD